MNFFNIYSDTQRIDSTGLQDIIKNIEGKTKCANPITFKKLEEMISVQYQTLGKHGLDHYYEQCLFTMPATTFDDSKYYRPTVIFDLDKTLVTTNKDRSLLEGEHRPYRKKFVMERPGVLEAMLLIQKNYNIALFSRGTDTHVLQLTKGWREKGVDFKQCLSRVDTTQFEGAYFKDLTKISPNLKKTVMIDDSLDMFMQPLNHILTSEFTGSKDDDLFKNLIPFLEILMEFKDFRLFNWEYCWKRSIPRYYNHFARRITHLKHLNFKF